MTDESGTNRDGQEQEHAETQELVRRLLAAARHDEPAPPDVVARLDAALADEAARRPGEAPPTPSTPSTQPTGVVDLDVRRRQRRRTGLLAAAVVVVAGVGLGAVGLDGGFSGSGEDSGAEQSAGGADSGAADSQDPPSALRQDESAGPEAMGARAPLPRVRTGVTLAQDVTRALRAAESLPAGRARCAPASAGDEVVRVVADGDRAELLAGPVSGGSREVSLHPCGVPDADTPLATLVVPAG